MIEMVVKYGAMRMLRRVTPPASGSASGGNKSSEQEHLENLRTKINSENVTIKMMKIEKY